ncbi:unnamed protein product [Diamesa serratosioi]
MNNVKDKLLKLREIYHTAFEELLKDEDAEIPFDKKRLWDMRKMLLGDVNMTDKLLVGLETALQKLLRCRMIIDISDDESESDNSDIVEVDQESNADSVVNIKSVNEVVNENTLKVPKSKNYKRIGEYSSMIQKDQFLDLPEECESIPESSEIENTKPTSNTQTSTAAYVLKITKLRPASSYAKPMNTENRKIVTVPYKSTVKLPSKVSKPIKKLNTNSNKTVPKAAKFDPRNDAIAIKNIKEKLYQKSYLKINKDEAKAITAASTSKTTVNQNNTDVDGDSSSTEIIETPPKTKSKPKARKTTENKSSKNNKTTKAKDPVKRKTKKTKPQPTVVNEDSDCTIEFKSDSDVDMQTYGKDNLFYSPPKTYPVNWIDSMSSKSLSLSPKVPIIEASASPTFYDSIDPEGLMEPLSSVVFKRKREVSRSRKTTRNGLRPRSNTVAYERTHINTAMEFINTAVFERNKEIDGSRNNDTEGLITNFKTEMEHINTVENKFEIKRGRGRPNKTNQNKHPEGPKKKGRGRPSKIEKQLSPAFVQIKMENPLS